MPALLNPFIGGLVNPLTLSPILWLEADYVGTYTSDGASFTHWDDQGTGGTNAVSGSAVYRANYTSLGKPAIEFNGTSHQLECARDASATERTIVLIVQFDDFSSYHTPLGQRSAAGGRAFRPGQTGDNPGKFQILNAATTLIGTSSATMTAATPYVATCTIDSSGNWSMTLNGSAAGSGSGASFTASRTSYIGAQFTSSTVERMKGAIALVGEWNRALTSTELQQVLDWLRVKYPTIY